MPKHNKLDKTKIFALCENIKKKEGEGSVFSLGKDSGLKMNRWSTGIEDLDKIIGGGMPCGRIVEIYGAEASGKTSLGYHLASLHEMALDVPIEGCVDCDTEFFDGTKWKKISEYKIGDKVLQYNADGTAEMVYPESYVTYDADYLWRVYGKRLDMAISEYHNVVYKTISDKLMIVPFHNIRERIQKNKEGFAGNVPKTFEYMSKGINLDENTIRLMIAVFADGHFGKDNNTNYCTIGLTKERKKERLEWLLYCNSITFKKRETFTDDRKQTWYTFYAPMRCKHYPSEWYNMSLEQFKIVIDEMKYWDGNSTSEHVPYFYTSDKNDADFMQFAYTVCGYPAYIAEHKRKKPYCIKGRKINNAKIAYDISSGCKSKIASLRRCKVEKIKTKDGKMYCFTMPSKMWIMRRNNKIIVTGNTFDADRAKIFRNKEKQLIVYRAKYGEEALNQAIKFAEAGIPIIIIDSIPACKPREDIEKLKKMAETGTETSERIGGVARVMHRYLPLLEEICERTGTTVILINQVRDKLDALPFGDKTDTPGGRAPKFYSSIRMQIARKGWIEIPNKDPHNTAANEKIGMIAKIKITKSKVSNPMGECEIPLIFDRGFVSFEEMQEIRKERMKVNRVKPIDKERKDKNDEAND